MSFSASSDFCLKAIDANSEETGVLLDSLTQRSRLELIDVPVRPEVAAVKECGLLRSSPNGEIPWEFD